MKDIEKDIVQTISPLAQLLGAERVDKLKDDICEAILEQVKTDLADSYDFTISFEDIEYIIEEAKEEVRNKVKRMFKDKFLALALEAVGATEKYER